MSQEHNSSVCPREGPTLHHHVELIICPIYSPPWLQLSPQQCIPTVPTTTVPQSWALPCASSRFMEQLGWASPLFGFPGHS